MSKNAYTKFYVRPWIEYTTSGNTTPEGGTPDIPGGTPEGTPGTPEGTPDDGKNEVTITDDSTPLYSGSDLMTAPTDIAKEEVPLAELPEEEVPMAQVPKTGDAALLWAMMSALSGIALAGLTVSARKSREENA